MSAGRRLPPGFGPAEYAEGVQALAILEVSATALAAPLIGPADLAAARRANEAVARSLEQLSPAAFSESNHEFHRALYGPCPNTYLTDLVEREWTRVFLTGDAGLRFVPERGRAVVAEHVRLLELIAARADVAAIEECVRAHRLRTT